MIQRIQSLFLFIAFLACVATFFFPLASFWAEEGSYKFFISGLAPLFPTDNPLRINAIPLIIINSLMGLTAIGIIFLYKKRLLQLRVLRFCIMFAIILILLILFFYVPAVEKITFADVDYTSDIGIYFPLLCLVLLILANRAINKDEKLIRSADRLR